MSNSVIIFTNLFTLKNKDVKENKYIDMYYIWLHNIIKYGKLKDNDTVLTFIDSVTFEYLKQSISFNTLSSIIKNFKVILYEQPENIKEGILQRYYVDKIFEVVKVNDAFYIHLDIDVLVIQDIRSLFKDEIQNNKTTLYLKTEEKLLGSNYYGELITEDEKEMLFNRGMLDMPGFSAGIYGWKGSSRIKEYFDFILDAANKNTKDLYTVEQPFFNAAIFQYFFKKLGVFNFVIWDDSNVGHNRFSNQVASTVTLLNFCGIPGDDSFHWHKIFIELLMSSIQPN